MYPLKSQGSSQNHWISPGFNFPSFSAIFFLPIGVLPPHLTQLHSRPTLSRIQTRARAVRCVGSETSEEAHSLVLILYLPIQAAHQFQPYSDSNAYGTSGALRTLSVVVKPRQEMFTVCLAVSTCHICHNQNYILFPTQS